MAIEKTVIIQNAQKFTIKGQIDKAIEEWQKLIKETPNDGNVYNTIGDLYLKKNNNSEAIAAYLKAASVFNIAGFSLKTIAVYKKIIKISPENYDIYIKLADLDAERGLIGNAIEEYLKVIRHNSKNGSNKDSIPIYKKLVDLDSNNIMMRTKFAELCVKEGQKADAVEQHIKIADIYKTEKKFFEAEEALQRALSLDPGNSRTSMLLEELKTASVAEPNPPTTPSENFTSIGGYQEFTIPSDRPVEEKAGPAAEHEAISPSNHLAAEEKPIEDQDEKQIDISSLIGEAEGAEFPELSATGEPDGLSEAKETPPPSYLFSLNDGSIEDKLAEGEFYSQQGLLGEARIIYETILRLSPDNAFAKIKLKKVLIDLNETDHTAALDPVQEISEAVSFECPVEPADGQPEEIKDMPQPAPVKGSPGSFAPGKVKLKTTVLDKTDKTDFVNLLGELEEDFEDDSYPSLDTNIQDEDFNKVIKEFQRGIQKNIGEKDIETHFNLGIAYKEMGLRTEAIGEFQISIKGAARRVDSAVILAQCYVEEGMTKLAVEQILQAVQIKELNSDQIHSLKYELASLYELQESFQESIDVLSDIYKENVHYRDVAKKIALLRQKNN